MSHMTFQHQVAASLAMDRAGTGRKRATKVQVTGSKGLMKPEHDWVKLDSKNYCHVCDGDEERHNENHWQKLTFAKINGGGEVLNLVGDVLHV